jgi:hypothetical protein
MMGPRLRWNQPLPASRNVKCAFPTASSDIITLSAERYE